MAMAAYKIELLNEFENKTSPWTYVDFERRMKELRSSTSYHDAKAIIKDAHKEGKWPKTVKQYIISNRKSMGNWIDIASGIMSSLSEDERNEWIEEATES